MINGHEDPITKLKIPLQRIFSWNELMEYHHRHDDGYRRKDDNI
jgi:hypothetical protein